MAGDDARPEAERQSLFFALDTSGNDILEELPPTVTLTNPGSVIESTASIDSAQWTPLVASTLTPNVVYTTTVQASSGVQFYRIREP